jgi:hypothetical protein
VSYWWEQLFDNDFLQLWIGYLSIKVKMITCLMHIDKNGGKHTHHLFAYFYPYKVPHVFIHDPTTWIALGIITTLIFWICNCNIFHTKRYYIMQPSSLQLYVTNCHLNYVLLILWLVSSSFSIYYNYCDHGATSFLLFKISSFHVD